MSVAFTSPSKAVETIDQIAETSQEYINNTHNSYELTTTKESHTNSVIINGTTYYFTPEEATEAKNTALVNLVHSGMSALKEVNSDEDYIFKAETTYWTYDDNKLPQSAWESTTTGASEENYSYDSFTPNATGKYEPEYYAINLRTSGMSSTDSTTFETAESGPSDFSFDNDTQTGTGVIAVSLPRNGSLSTSETKYYTYTYTVPNEYTQQETRVTAANISKKYFYYLTSNSNGGAVYIESSGSGDISAEFIQNHITGNPASGGAIYNEGTITSLVGDFIGNKSTGYGTAIYNTGTMNITSENISDNSSATNQGYGAIYNTGTMSLSATDADLKFYNNKSGSTYADVYNEGTLNLNANENKAIIFGGTVTGSTGTINLNNDATVKGGDYVFNNEISGNNLNLYNGAKVKLASAVQTDGTTTYGTLDLSSYSFTNSAVAGAILDSQNVHNDYINLGAVTLNSDLSLKLDADFAHPIINDFTYYTDTYYASSFSGVGQFIIDSLLIDNNAEEAEFETKIGNSVLINHIALSDNFEPVLSENIIGNYLISLKNKEDGIYFKFIYMPFTNLVSSVRQSSDSLMYTMSEDENVADDLADLELTDNEVGTQGGTSLIGYETNIGFTALLTDNLSAAISYMGAYRSGYQEHTGMLSLKYKF